MNNIINTAYKREFVKTRQKLKNKFEILLNKPETSKINPQSTVSNEILQLQDETLPPQAIALLRKGPKFVIDQQKVFFIDIISATKIAAKNLTCWLSRKRWETSSSCCAGFAQNCSYEKPY